MYRRARDTEIRSDSHVPGSLNEVSEPMVITSLRAGRGRHGNDHRRFAHRPQLLKIDGNVRRRADNSLKKVHIVRADSSDAPHRFMPHCTCHRSGRDSTSKSSFVRQASGDVSRHSGLIERGVGSAEIVRRRFLASSTPTPARTTPTAGMVRSVAERLFS